MRAGLLFSDRENRKNQPPPTSSVQEKKPSDASGFGQESRGTEIVDVIADNPKESPVQQAMRLIKKWTEEGRIWLMDSFSTMIEQQVMWHKRFNCGEKQQMSLREHMHVVGNLRDLALFLAQRPGFTLFNTSPGGQQRTPEGQVVNIPKGILVGYAALSGLAEGKETVLSRFTTSWIATPGTIATDRHARVPRGFILPWHDIRGGEIGNFAPIKDQKGFSARGVADG